MYDPLTICRRDIDVILDEFYSHLVPDETHSVLARDPWAAVEGSSIGSNRCHILT